MVSIHTPASVLKVSVETQPQVAVKTWMNATLDLTAGARTEPPVRTRLVATTALVCLASGAKTARSTLTIVNQTLVTIIQRVKTGSIPTPVIVNLATPAKGVRPTSMSVKTTTAGMEPTALIGSTVTHANVCLGGQEGCVR